VEEKLIIFRKFHILNNYFNEAFVWILVPIIFIWNPCSNAIACAFGALRFRNILSFFEYMPFPALLNNFMVILAVTMVPSTGVYESSLKLHKCLKHAVLSKKNKVLRKELNSLNPFGVRVGVINKVRKLAILMSYYFISNNLFTLLITFPQAIVTH
jgi:hypothetical protein